MTDIFAQKDYLDSATDQLVKESESLFESLADMDLPQRVHALNRIRLALHKHSPFKSEPVDCVQWIESDKVSANDYNPNSVAPPEMKLLEHSITQDGYTQPIVAWQTASGFEVIDGFHRNRVGKESKTVRSRVHGYLPLTVANETRTDKGDRIAATIRHNRARGKHKVEAMSDIVIELKRRNWSDEKIARELGMDPDEVLRLCQITGLAEAFKDQDFSAAWEIEGAGDGQATTDIISDVSDEEEVSKDRIFHTWEKWECFRAGFYEDHLPNGMTQDEGEKFYQTFLADIPRFEKNLEFVTKNWKFSCEHYLTNDRMNRIAWLGQAAVCNDSGIPAVCRGGYNLLSEDQKYNADMMAMKWLNRWLVANGRYALTLGDAQSKTKADLY